MEIEIATRTMRAMNLAMFASQAETIESQAAEIRALRQQLAKVSHLEEQVSEMRAALTAMHAKDELVALHQ